MENVCIGHDSQHGMLKMLEPDARQRAIARASELVARGWHERRALSMATTWAQEWVDCGKPNAFASPAPGLHLMYEYDAWLLCPEQGTDPTHAFDWFEDALKHAHTIAAQAGGSVYVYDPDGRVVDTYESYGDAGLEESCTLHVMPLQGAWVLRGLGAEGTFRRFETKKEAVEEGRRVARSESATLVVHHRNHSLQQQMKYC